MVQHEWGRSEVVRHGKGGGVGLGRRRMGIEGALCVQCYCAVSLCRMEHWVPEACGPVGATLPWEGREGDVAAAREEGRRRALDKTTP